MCVYTHPPYPPVCVVTHRGRGVLCVQTDENFNSRKRKRTMRLESKKSCLICRRPIVVEGGFVEFCGHPEWLPVDPGDFGMPGSIGGGIWVGCCNKCDRKYKHGDNVLYQVIIERFTRPAALRRCFNRFPAGTCSGGVHHILADEQPWEGNKKWVWECGNCHSVIPDGETIDSNACKLRQCAGMQRADDREAARVIARKAEKQRKRDEAKALKRQRGA